MKSQFLLPSLCYSFPFRRCPRTLDRLEKLAQEFQLVGPMRPHMATDHPLKKPLLLVVWSPFFIGMQIDTGSA